MASPLIYKTSMAFLLQSPFLTRTPLTLTNFSTSRRTLSTVLLSAPCFLSSPGRGLCLEFKFVAPDLTVEEARPRARIHAQELVELKDLIQLESWKEAQKSLRSSASSLRQELYTIIQSMPGSRRPQLRKLYSDLFNSVTRA
ncbi:psbQ-like protein 3, chloroplastic isoform X2 [Nymphaea colorata]|uniref:psbQ-like protein 3, chloroplastic isoform X2 n=1 Tax=Nymphaea colorata TaxID=210225 RepID=UPI00129ED8A7|nr:psbQ-like protein 3, chloroplastic isoform X2 [Nymphaea colorata]